MFAAVCVLLAVTGHVLMSGTAVPWWAMLPAFAVTATGAWALADRERGLLAVTTATVAVQGLLHAGFSLTQLPMASATAGTPDRHGLPGTGFHTLHGMQDMHGMHEMADMPGMAAMTIGTGLPAAGHDMAGMSTTGMTAAHLLAAVLCGLWLAYAEQAAFRLLRSLAGWLWAPLRVLFGLLAPPPHRPRLHVRRARRGHALRQLLLVHAITSRGPPTGTAVL
ncbi:hypothetical protein AB0F18_25885 [Streptomyces sp. NPDC029216]|uniref:hypothetical protein n=1 Tax=Streptomyces sp. NPDC029216 TaxID=3154701 RepID=UPI0033C2D689